jgi:hypothetical protein
VLWVLTSQSSVTVLRRKTTQKREKRNVINVKAAVSYLANSSRVISTAEEQEKNREADQLKNTRTIRARLQAVSERGETQM